MSSTQRDASPHRFAPSCPDCSSIPSARSVPALPQPVVQNQAIDLCKYPHLTSNKGYQDSLFGRRFWTRGHWWVPRTNPVASQSRGPPTVWTTFLSFRVSLVHISTHHTTVGKTHKGSIFLTETCLRFLPLVTPPSRLTLRRLWP